MLQMDTKKQGLKVDDTHKMVFDILTPVKLVHSKTKGRLHGPGQYSLWTLRMATNGLEVDTQK